MTIKKVGDSRWLIRVDAGIDKRTGKRIQKQRTITGNKQAALREEAQLMSMHGTLVRRSGTLTLDEYLLGVWIPSLADRSPNTVYRYRNHCLYQVAPTLGSVKLDRLNAASIEALLRDMPGQGHARSVFRTLRAALNQAVRWDYIDRNPCDRVTLPRAPLKDTNQASAYSLDEVAVIAAAIQGEWFEPLWIACAFGGLRPEEACGLDCPPAGWDGVVDVSRAYASTGTGWEMRQTKTQGSVRRVPLGDYPVSRILTATAGRIGPMVVRPSDGKRATVKDLWKAYRKFCARELLPYLPPKNLRHTAATLMLSSGADIAVVSRILGHSAVSTTANFYLRPLASAQEFALSTYSDKVAAILNLEPSGRAVNGT